MDASDARLDEWPRLRQLLDSTPPGKHGHARWNATTEAAFWQAFGVPLGQPDKEIWVQDGGVTFRVRVLSC